MNAVLDFLRAALPWITIGLLYAVLFTIRAELKKREKQAADCGAEGMSLGIVLGVGFEICFANNSGMGLAGHADRAGHRHLHQAGKPRRSR